MIAKNELLNDFILESFENLQQASECLNLIAKGENCKENLNSVYRSVHTLKGSACLINFKSMQENAHLVETVLDYLRDETLPLSEEIVDLMTHYVDSVFEELKVIETTGSESPSDETTVRLRFLHFLERVAGAPKMGRGAIQNKFTTLGKTSTVETKQSVSSYSQKDDKNHIFKQTPEKVEQNAVAVQSQPSEAVKEKVENSSTSIVDSTIRVNVNLLDKIMNKVGELVLNRNQILQFTNDHSNPLLNKLAQQLNVITTELQTDIMTTRMQPVSSVLSKFERLVRDHSRESGKKIKLKLVGQETELDKSLLEIIKDPLTHIVRNSIDHGLELPKDRVQSGKSEEGTLTIRSYHESGQVIIEVSDDGRGLDRSKILSKAIEKGLVSAESASNLSEEQIFALIFKPGFSTAAQVTKISGRGVGMDVVKTNIEKIGGGIILNSELGRSTTIKLRIPLTLAIIPALTVNTKGQVFAIPQTNIEELVRFEGDVGQHFETVLSSEFIRLRGQLIPVFRLSNVLDLENVEHKSSLNMKALDDDQIINKKIENQKNSASENDSVNIVVLNAEGTTFGIVVERILDTEEIVVKPLERCLAELTYFAGATIMGNGDVALIIDALGFYNSVSPQNEGADHKRTLEEVKDTDTLTPDFHENILFSLSDERTYSVPLALVSRLEEFIIDDVEKVGKNFVVRYNNKPMVLIALDKALGLTEGNLKKSDLGESVHTLVVNLRGINYGLMVKTIIDIAVTNSPPDSDTVDRRGFLGTLYINEKIVTLLDVHEIISSLDVGFKINLDKKEQSKFAGKTLLVVEDSPVYRKMEVDTFESMGFKVLVATNGQEGLEIAQKERAHLSIIVTDIEMPLMTGYELAHALRFEYDMKEIPIVAISTKVGAEDLEKGKKSGFSKHIEKFRKDEVMSAVGSFF